MLPYALAMRPAKEAIVHSGAASDADKSQHVALAVVVAALGYFVDIYDLILFAIVRVKSLQGLNVESGALLDTGVLLLNMQMGGMLIGGILWGVLGDKRGRLSVLFGSIFLYSAANIANGLVQDVTTYAALRFIAGVGLAGELGAGITLVAEIMHRERRGYGTTIVASVGIMGAVVAVLVGDFFSWRVAYFTGGGLGVALLLLRIGVHESSMFQTLRSHTAVARGNFIDLFRPRSRGLRYLSVVLIGLPIWYVVAILVTFSPELGKAMGMPVAPSAGQAVLWCYIGLAVGDISSGLLSQRLKSRKKVVLIFLILTALSIGVYFSVAGMSLSIFYATCGLLGFSTGYWAVFVTMAAEQFGTNLRATATTTAPNFVRGAVVPVTMAFQYGKQALGVTGSALLLAAITLFIAAIALRQLTETFGRDLDFIDSASPNATR